MAVEGLSYTQYLYSISDANARQVFLNLSSAVNAGQITPNEFASQVEALSGRTVKIHRAINGDVLGYTLQQSPTYNTASAINSNVSTISRGTVSMPVSTGIDSQTGKAVTSRLAGVGTKITTGAALVGTAAMAVSAGITLGKTIDSVLYNANPDFWDSNNMGSINPETWRAITAGDDSLGASLLNVLFGFDENDDSAQAYMSEDALAYFAAYMYQNGVFGGSSVPSQPSGITLNYPDIYPFPYALPQVTSIDVYPNAQQTVYWHWDFSGTAPIYAVNITNNNRYTCYVFSSQPFTTTRSVHDSWSGNAEYNNDTRNHIIYYQAVIDGFNFGGNCYSIPAIPIRANVTSNGIQKCLDLYEMWVVGAQSTAPDGIGDQTGATIPSTNGWDDYSNILPSLQQQYPDLWNNAITYPVVQDDGSVKNYTYVPVSMPENFTRTGTQPESGNSTQTQPEIDPSTATQELIDILTKILTNPLPQTEEDLNNPNPPENPTDIGDGSSPPLIVPVGSASSLWKIYHPTQAQIDSFGGWLWSSNFIDQILKIFNNPMEAVIGLHKVYATPIDAGTTTIKVGYLDSQVPSAYIEQQYIEVSCGSVNLYEQFGNVFDYSPFTDVQLYLPFVGIVPLNVADVMRSTISVNYGVDVITGACLAQVEVSRDGNSSVLYQYSGNCAVQYPISSGSYMGIVSSIISVAGGVAATVASGGAAAPLALGAAGGLLSAHTSVQHSGGFSGNAGAMGGKIPYLIITRPQTKVAINAETMQGYPTNNYVTVGECSGYIKADSVHVINVNATDEELTEINNLLLSGIII